MCSACLSLENDAEAVDERLADERVVAREQEVPGERAEPGQLVTAVHAVPDADDFRVALELNREHLRAHTSAPAMSTEHWTLNNEHWKLNKEHWTHQ